ncbi:hypothetical protein D3C78_1746740 [compost metagenome]
MADALFDQAPRGLVVTALDDHVGAAASHHPNALTANSLGPSKHDSNHSRHVSDHCTSSLIMLDAVS